MRKSRQCAGFFCNFKQPEKAAGGLPGDFPEPVSDEICVNLHRFAECDKK